MQWESGRTGHNLLHVVRESKAKRPTSAGVLQEPFPQYSVLTKLVLFFSANVSPQWTIFATCFWRQQQKCSVSYTSCDKQLSPANGHRSHDAKSGAKRTLFARSDSPVVLVSIYLIKLPNFNGVTIDSSDVPEGFTWCNYLVCPRNEKLECFA